MTTLDHADPANIPMQMFVSLPVRPEQLERYLALTHAELAGARSEAGNTAFFAYRNLDEPSRLHLFEHWNSEAWLTQDHASKSYYQEMRGVEPEVIDGEVGEMMLRQIQPLAPTPIDAAPVGFARATVMRGSGLEEIFAERAGDWRGAPGAQAIWLFANSGDPQEYLLLEHWASEGDRSATGESGPQTLESAAERVLTIRLQDITAAP